MIFSKPLGGFKLKGDAFKLVLKDDYAVYRMKVGKEYVEVWTAIRRLLE